MTAEIMKDEVRSVKSQHTAGPWITNNHRSNDSTVAITTTDETFNVGVVYRKPDKETGEANARLIAAAPELLAALKEAAAILRPLVHAMNVRTHFHEKNVLANSIDKAIAKATGETP